MRSLRTYGVVPLVIYWAGMKFRSPKIGTFLSTLLFAIQWWIMLMSLLLPALLTLLQSSLDAPLAFTLFSLYGSRDGHSSSPACPSLYPCSLLPALNALVLS